MRVDHHAHWLPQTLLRRLQGRARRPYTTQGDGAWTFTAAVRARPLGLDAWDLHARLARLDAAGIEVQLLSLSSLWGIDTLPVDEALPLVRTFNDATAEACDRMPRYRAIAAVPVDDVGAACDELERACGQGAVGVALPAIALADGARVEAWAPLLQAADARGLRVFVHPGPLDLRDDAPPSSWRRAVGLAPQHELGDAMLAWCESPLARGLGRATIQFANLGGSLPGAIERLSAIGEDTLAVPANVSVDAAGSGSKAIRLAREVLGEDRVLFGTDMPIDRPDGAVARWAAAAADDAAQPLSARPAAPPSARRARRAPAPAPAAPTARPR